MQFSKIIGSLVSASLITNVMGAPHEAKKRDDDDDPVVVHIKTTVQNTQTNVHTVEGKVQTKTNWIVDTSTATVTSYTATVTSTVFGTPYTFVTVATTPIDVSSLSLPTEIAAQTEIETTQAKAATTPTTVPTTTAPTTTTSTSVTPKASAAVTQTTSTEVAEVTDSNDGPTITDSNNIPTSTDSWIIENVTTMTSDSVCYVNYDYYYASEADETITSTSTIYTTVTRSWSLPFLTNRACILDGVWDLLNCMLSLTRALFFSSNAMIWFLSSGLF